MLNLSFCICLAVRKTADVRESSSSAGNVSVAGSVEVVNVIWYSRYLLLGIWWEELCIWGERRRGRRRKFGNATGM